MEEAEGTKRKHNETREPTGEEILATWLSLLAEKKKISKRLEEVDEKIKELEKKPLIGNVKGLLRKREEKEKEKVSKEERVAKVAKTLKESDALTARSPTKSPKKPKKPENAEVSNPETPSKKMEIEEEVHLQGEKK